MGAESARQYPRCCRTSRLANLARSQDLKRRPTIKVFKPDRAGSCAAEAAGSTCASSPVDMNTALVQQGECRKEPSSALKPNGDGNRHSRKTHRYRRRDLCSFLCITNQSETSAFSRHVPSKIAGAAAPRTNP